MKADAGMPEVELARIASGRRQAVELAVDLALRLDPLGRALLDVGGAVERLGEPGGVADPPEHRLGIVHQGEAGEILEPRRERIARPLQGGGLGVVQHDLVAGPAEHDRPGLTDQAAPHQRDLLHGASPGCTVPGHHSDLAAVATRERDSTPHA